MKNCAMCGTKLLGSMIPFKVLIPGAKPEGIDTCGQCFLLTRMNDALATISNSMRKETPYGESGRLEH